MESLLGYLLIWGLVLLLYEVGVLAENGLYALGLCGFHRLQIGLVGLLAERGNARAVGGAGVALQAAVADGALRAFVLGRNAAAQLADARFAC